MSNDDKKKPNADDLSLAELIGHKGGSPTDDYDSLDSDQQRNEAGSGLINLAAMVDAGTLNKETDNKQAANPFEAAQTANAAASEHAPSSPADAPQTASVAPSEPINSPAQAPVISAPAKKKKKGLALGIAAAVVLIAGLGAAAFVMQNRKQDTSQQTLTALEAEMAALHSQAIQSEADQARARELESQIAHHKALQDNDATDNISDSNAEEVEMTFDDAPEGDDANKADSKSGNTRRPRRRSPSAATKSSGAPKSSGSAVTSSAQTKKSSDAPAAKASPVPEASKNDSPKETASLDKLLAGGTQKAQTGGLPDTPSRSQVQSAMNQVRSKARSTCRQGTGTVNVRVVVSSNGRVRDAIPVGEHSASSLGRCVAKVARSVGRFPKFSNPTFQFTYPIKI